MTHTVLFVLGHVVGKVDVSMPTRRLSAMNCHDTMKIYEGPPHCWKSGIAFSAERGSELDHPRITAAFWKRDFLLHHNAQESSIFRSEDWGCPTPISPIWWPRWTICLQKLISNNDDDTMTIILFTMTAKTNFFRCHDTSPTSDAWHRALTHKLIAVGSLGPRTMKRTWATCSSPG